MATKTKAKPQPQPKEPLPVDDSLNFAITLGAFRALRQFCESTAEINCSDLLCLIDDHISQLELIKGNHGLLLNLCLKADLIDRNRRLA